MERIIELRFEGKIYTEKSDIIEIINTESKWLQNCEIENAVIEIKDSKVYWYSGIFYYGYIPYIIWFNGIFKSGIFNGVWHNGTFENGVFKSGIFMNGVFKDGVFEDGEFRDGKILGGTFNNKEEIGQLKESYVSKCSDFIKINL